MIDVHVMPGLRVIGAEAANRFDEVVRGGGRVLGLATGSSPDQVYAELVNRHAASPGSYRACRVFLLDEYVGLPQDHPERYAAVIRRTVTDPLGIPRDRVHAPDVDARDLAAAGERYDDAIAAAGGVDLQLLGVGTNGHIAFNEPGATLARGTHVARLTDRTRQDNARFFGGRVDAVPRAAMTQGIGTILRARRLLLIAAGAAKADAIAGLVSRPADPELPVTALHRHPAVTVLVDPAAASGISEADLLPDVRMRGHHDERADRRIGTHADDRIRS